MISFAVVIPLYNKAAHIERALASIRAQNTEPNEIIVVDDASTDQGLEIVERYEGVRILKRQTPGPGGYAARNLAIRAANSDFIAFLDADDEWRPDHLTRMKGIIEAAPAGATLFATGYEERHLGGRVVTDVYNRVGKPQAMTSFELDRFLSCWLSVGECPVWTSAIVARRTALLEAGLFPEARCRRGGDKDLWLRLAALGTVVIDPVSTAIYHKDSENMVTSALHGNICHCIVDTLVPLSIGRDPKVRHLLRKLGNHETYLYALRTAKSARVQRSLWRGFSAALDPFRYIVLLLLSSPLGVPLARAAQWRRKPRAQASV